MVDTDGRALVMQVHPANIQDRDGAIPLLKASRKSFPFVALAFADSAYGAQRVKDATSIVIEIVKRLGETADKEAGDPSESLESELWKCRPTSTCATFTFKATALCHVQDVLTGRGPQCT